MASRSLLPWYDLVCCGMAVMVWFGMVGIVWWGSGKHLGRQAGGAALMKASQSAASTHNSIRTHPGYKSHHH